MSSEKSKKVLRMLPSLLMAGTMAVPGMALDQKAVDELALKASRERPDKAQIIDNQGNYDRLGQLIAPQWGRVWAKVVWARVGEEETI